MRAAILEKFGDPLVERDVDLSDVAPDEVLVRVVASGICHSDRLVHLGTQDRPLPLVLGHEASGIVEQAWKNWTGRTGRAASFISTDLVPAGRRADIGP
jgi:Zn-dependent alcohol dehydrogenase